LNVRTPIIKRNANTKEEKEGENQKENNKILSYDIHSLIAYYGNYFCISMNTIKVHIIRDQFKSVSLIYQL